MNIAKTELQQSSRPGNTGCLARIDTPGGSYETMLNLAAIHKQ